MQITLIRHLPTKWNQEGILQGRQDIGLLPVSNEQAEKIGENKVLLAEQGPFDRVLASSLTRTYETAKQYGFNPEREPLLDELHFGNYEGCPKQLLFDDFGEQWINRPETVRLGESLPALQERIKSFLEKYHMCDNILLFGHGAWIRSLLSYVKNGDLSEMNKGEVPNNEPIIVKINPST